MVSQIIKGSGLFSTRKILMVLGIWSRSGQVSLVICQRKIKLQLRDSHSRIGRGLHRTFWGRGIMIGGHGIENLHGFNIPVIAMRYRLRTVSQLILWS